MEVVKDWLRSFELETYSAAFELNRWNELSLLPEMSEKDVNMCITKGGDAMRLRKAIENLCSSSEDSDTQPKHRDHMSLVLRKPVFGVSDQVPHKPGCTATEDG